ncbi:MAG TPA: IclR family transcriptional regulator [Candidatus Limnocylindrales bacterium]|jgi:DNA-binding IclR family transcriptional regulator|nr:IclR family transcriptional regulator [Candidatus Limnocylindrales bacterium]
MSTARDRPPEEAQEDTSFARGLRVLLTIADRGEIRADELSTLLETPVSTIYRYLRTLSDFGFIDRQGSGYRLGPRLIIGSGANVTAEELIRTADPILRLLADETGETAIIVRRIGLAAVCLHEIPSSQALRVTFAPTTSLPLNSGAFGKALLAFAPPEILDEVIALDGLGGATILDPDRLRADLADVVTSGVAKSVGEVVSGSVAIAAPIFREDGIVAAIGVTGPEGRCGLAWRTRVSRLLPGAASSVVGALGGGLSSQDSRYPE